MQRSWQVGGAIEAETQGPRGRGQGWGPGKGRDGGGMRVKAKPENPLVVQWLRLLPMQGAWVQSQLWEPRSHMPLSMAKKILKKESYTYNKFHWVLVSFQEKGKERRAFICLRRVLFIKAKIMIKCALPSRQGSKCFA